MESIRTNGDSSVWHFNGCQPSAAVESALSYISYIFRNHKGSEAAASVEGIIVDSRYVVRYYQVLDLFAIQIQVMCII